MFHFDLIRFRYFSHCVPTAELPAPRISWDDVTRCTADSIRGCAFFRGRYHREQNRARSCSCVTDGVILERKIRHAARAGNRRKKPRQREREGWPDGWRINILSIARARSATDSIVCCNISISHRRRRRAAACALLPGRRGRRRRCHQQRGYCMPPPPSR